MSKETRLRRIILGIGIGTFVLLVAVVLVWKLKFYDTVNADIATQQTAYDTAKAQADKLPTALADKTKAEQKKKFAQAQLDYLRLRFRSLSFDLSSPGATEATFGRYLNEYFEGYGLALRRQLLTAAAESGVQLDTKAAVVTPPQTPETVQAPPSGFLKPLTGGSLDMTVIGSYENILRFLDRINHSEILMTVGNIKLAKGGTTGGASATTTASASDSITANFLVTPYLLATGPSAPVGTPPLPAGAAPAAGAPGDPNAPGGPPADPNAPPAP
jgi:hypothetical protein